VQKFSYFFWPTDVPETLCLLLLAPLTVDKKRERKEEKNESNILLFFLNCSASQSYWTAAFSSHTDQWARQFVWDHPISQGLLMKLLIWRTAHWEINPWWRSWSRSSNPLP